MLRDWLWPRITSSTEQEQYKRLECKAAGELAGQVDAIPDDTVDAFYESCVRVYDNEEARRRTAEVRASALLGGLAVLSALVVVFGPNVLRGFWSQPSRTGAVIALWYMIAVFYFGVAVVRTLRAMEIDVIHVLTSIDLVAHRPLAPGFKRRLAAEILHEAVGNGPVIDRKLNTLSEALFLMRTGVLAIALLGATLGVRVLYHWMCQLPNGGMWGQARKLASCF